jgi:hypothetical protein
MVLERLRWVLHRVPTLKSAEVPRKLCPAKEPPAVGGCEWCLMFLEEAQWVVHRVLTLAKTAGEL